MKEELLQFIWQNTLFDRTNFHTSTGDTVEIIKTGIQNFNSGPDFLNAKIKIGNTTWAGNVEIHVNASSWNAHGHDKDEAYNNVILHVVLKNDAVCRTAAGAEIPCAEITIDSKLEVRAKELFQAKKWIFCEPWFKDAGSFTITFWLESLLIERLKHRSEQILRVLKENINSWEETFYQILMRAFGFGLNADSFQEIAEKTPLIVLAKHKDNLLQLEALFFGQANLLPQQTASDEYVLRLQREYEFLRNKYKLEPISNNPVRFLRLRPQNFPTIRLSQFACLVHKSSSLFSKVLGNPNIEFIFNLMSVNASEYWESHYTFNKQSSVSPKTLGQKSLHAIVINAIAPLLFSYGLYSSNEELQEKAIALLEAIPYERNKITNNWEELGVEPVNAGCSQSVYFLYTNYCERKRCLQCTIGKTILSKIR